MNSKQAGRFQITSTEPSPVWFVIDAKLHNGDAVQFFGLRHEDLHDLRYLIDRMLATTPER